jgi:hypothetical protein
MNQEQKFANRKNSFWVRKQGRWRQNEFEARCPLSDSLRHLGVLSVSAVNYLNHY